VSRELPNEHGDGTEKAAKKSLIDLPPAAASYSTTTISGKAGLERV
jgi:hypothetical protein